MKIYRSEKSLETKLANKTKANLILPVNVIEDNTELFIDNLKTIHENKIDERIGKNLAKVIANDAHPDLMYGSAILVSTVMNKNDDVFLPEETWRARKTPINTPYNDEHVDTDIIGHIIAARPLDKDGNIIDATEPPNYFDIEVDFVVYKSIFPAIASDISEKGPKGEKFVSMEATFDDFDYALVEFG
jgi:hypothetical protein